MCCCLGLWSPRYVACTWVSVALLRWLCFARVLHFRARSCSLVVFAASGLVVRSCRSGVPPLFEAGLMLPFALVGLHFHSCLFLGQLVAFFMLVLVLADSLLLLLVGWEGIGSAPLF